MSETRIPWKSYERDFLLEDDFPRPPQADRKDVDLGRPAPSTLRSLRRENDLLTVELGSDPNFATRCFGNLLLAMALVGAMVATGVAWPIRLDWGPGGSSVPGGSLQEAETP